MHDVKVKVHRFDAARARSVPPVPLDSVFDGTLSVEATGPDAERKAVQQAVKDRFGKRVRGCSALAGGGYTLIIDP